MPCSCPVEAWPPSPDAPDRRAVYSAARSYAGARGYLRPCGRCRACRVSKVRDLTTRMIHEASMHDSNSFLTCTFAPEHLPADLSIRKEHVQDFMKRLRYHLGLVGISVRFVGVGEYGEQFLRPHYHFILFGCDFAFDWRAAGVSQSGEIYYQSPTLTKAWGLGFCTVQPVTVASCGYVAGYSMKKMTGKYAVDKYLRFDGETGEAWTVEPEFALQSRMPGIGKSWFDKYWRDAFPSDFVICDGRKRPVPSYYLRLLDALDPQEAYRIRAARSAKLHEERSLREATDPRRLTRHESGLLAAQRAYPRGEGMQ